MVTKMKGSRLAIAAMLVAAGWSAWADTPYPLADGVAAANRAKVVAAGGQAPLAVASVEALSAVRRTPDAFPADGDFAGPLSFIAARGEYEAGSLSLFSFEGVSDCRAEATALAGPDGAAIPASALDLRVVKVWYQQGTAWVGYHGDPTQSVATPELLLKDDDLVRVDHAEREQFVRLSGKDGAPDVYEWISFRARMADWSRFAGMIDFTRIRDAKDLKPFALQKNAFKQLWVTLRVPTDAKPGFYRGKIAFRSGTRALAEKAVAVRVLPFALPLRPELYRDPARDYRIRICTRDDVMDFTRCDAYAKNLAAHNVIDSGLPALTGCTDEEAKAIVERAKANGLSEKTMRIAHCAITTSYPPEEDDARYWQYRNQCEIYTNDVRRAKALGGEDVLMISGGIDEASPSGIRAQRATWQAVHALGGKTFCSSRMARYVLFNADVVDQPVQPSPIRKEAVDRVHAMDPDMIVSWYADPHCGPESPAYTRWLYSWKSWMSNYDESSNYVLFRNNWCEWWYPQEPQFRNMCWAYPAADAIIDTLAWEAYREAADDLRYATVMRRLARAAKASKDVDVSYRGRAALAWLAELDAERSDMNYIRLEIIDRTLKLMKALGKEVL